PGQGGRGFLRSSSSSPSGSAKRGAKAPPIPLQIEDFRLRNGRRNLHSSIDNLRSRVLGSAAADLGLEPGAGVGPVAGGRGAGGRRAPPRPARRSARRRSAAQPAGLSAGPSPPTSPAPRRGRAAPRPARGRPGRRAAAAAGRRRASASAGGGRGR